MAVLSDQEIWLLIKSSELKIEPVPDLGSVSPSTIDLTLANNFRVPEVEGGSAVKVLIDSRDSEDVMKAIKVYSRDHFVKDGESFDLEPNRFALAWTKERISVPKTLAARVEGRSTLARLGLSVHQSAPTVHPTFQGSLQLELTNAGPFTIRLYPGQRICQLILETMSVPSENTLDSIHQSQSNE